MDTALLYKPIKKFYLGFKIPNSIIYYIYILFFNSLIIVICEFFTSTP